MSRGIVRHIDALGRIVIPKELRRSLRIRENDPVEIEGTEDGLRLRKVSALKGLEFYAALAADCLGRRTGCAVMAADQALICAAPGRPELEGQALSEALRETLGEDLFRREEISFPLTEAGFSGVGLCAAPIRHLGERYGFLLMTGEKYPPQESALPLLEFAADLLGGLLGEA